MHFYYHFFFFTNRETESLLTLFTSLAQGFIALTWELLNTNQCSLTDSVILFLIVTFLFLLCLSFLFILCVSAIASVLLNLAASSSEYIRNVKHGLHPRSTAPETLEVGPGCCFRKLSRSFS